MGYLIDILIGAASRMVTSELSAHVEPMARWIIGKAVQRFPANDRNRFREEWLAHLDETPGTLRKLWHAVGCYLGAAKVAGVLAQQPPDKEAERKKLIFVWTENGIAVLSAGEARRIGARRIQLHISTSCDPTVRA